MPNFTKLILFLSFIGIWFSHIFNTETLINLGYVLILSFGILHGSNDLILIEKENKRNRSRTIILMNYITNIFLFSTFFYFFPIIGIVFFVLVSAYHFGEQHLIFISNIDSTNVITVFLFRFFYGLLILSILLFFHSEEVILIINNMTGFSIPYYVFFVLLLISIIFNIALYFYTQKILRKEFSLVFELFLILIFLLMFHLTPLIWGFSLYFILWHSLPSIKDQCEFLFEEFNLQTLLKYLKIGAPIWFISIAGFTLFYILFYHNKMIDTLLFSFIAAITFPHVITIFTIFNKKTE